MQSSVRWKICQNEPTIHKNETFIHKLFSSAHEAASTFFHFTGTIRKDKSVELLLFHFMHTLVANNFGFRHMDLMVTFNLPVHVATSSANSTGGCMYKGDNPLLPVDADRVFVHSDPMSGSKRCRSY